MPEDNGVYFGEETADLILDAVSLIQRSGDTVVDPVEQTLSPNQFWYVKLTADLDGATDSDTPATAAADVWEAKEDNTLQDTGESITVTNRYSNFSAVTGDLVSVILEEGEYTPVSPGSGGGTQILSFQVVSSDASTREALVLIQQRSFSGGAYGSSLGDTVVTVYDTDGCYLNEPNVDLTGRRGKAVLMYVDTEVEETHFPGGYPPVKYWNVLSLCCPQDRCGI